tara:strand:+ start:33 stop:1307 length:1275 start_codon:yes stop_codon:yes gene_type:complete
MKNFLKKLFNLRINNKKKNIKFSEMKKIKGVEKIFEIFHNYSDNSQIRFVGGCVRKILANEKIDDIDMATNLSPDQVISLLKINNVRFYESGLDHGTVTAIFDDVKFEITSLRKDISTDGRHAKVVYTDNWFEDASRRDFSINSIYADYEGNIFDPFDGISDLTKGKIKFIGNADQRIKEDYLRILRYLRFYINYSDNLHEDIIKRIIKQNLPGIKKISKERLLDELKKILMSSKFFNIYSDNFSLELIILIFPELKNIKLLQNLEQNKVEFIQSLDFILFVSLLIIDGTDNAEYFVYKYNLSKDEKKRIKFIIENYKNIDKKNFFSENNIKKLIYLNDKKLINDLICFKIIKSKKNSNKLIRLQDTFQNFEKEIFPIKAKDLISEFNLKEGKELGEKLKKIENTWLNNNFKISHDEIKNIVRN